MELFAEKQDYVISVEWELPMRMRSKCCRLVSESNILEVSSFGND